jgi:hypothetical protein
VNSDVFGCSSRWSKGAWFRTARQDVPKKHQDLDYIIGMLDWDANVNRTSATITGVPQPVCPFAERSERFPNSGCATAQSGARRGNRATGPYVTIKDAAAPG